MNTTSRREFLRNSGLAAGAASFAACGPALPPPNILWILAEDFSPDLGCYGNKQVHTPNIDRLASEGVLYTNACVTAPVCSAARSALMVGMYQTSVGGHNHRSHRVDGYKLPAGVRPFTAMFREAGYHTSNVKTPAEGLKVNGKTDFNYNLDEKPFDGDDWNQRPEGSNFYAQINFSETHRAFKSFPDRPIDPAVVELPPYYPDHPVVRKDFALYLETAQHLDVKVGKVLDRLEQEGLADNTIVFFFGDHGRPLPRGKQFLYEGGLLIPMMARIPEKYRPEDFEPGTENDNLISHIDITATSLALAGLERPSNMEGQVFIGPDSAPPRKFLFSARDRCDETVDRIRSVRTKHWKYIRNFMPERPYTQPNHYKDTGYPPLQVMRQLKAEGKLTMAQQLFMADSRPAEELYNLQADPHEVQNLAASGEQLDRIEEMRDALEAWIAETGDMGQTLEDPLPAEYKSRTGVDGWATSTGVLSKTDGALRMEWSGKANQVRMPWVVEGGEMILRFRARSSQVAPKEFFWGTVENVRGTGNKLPVEFTPNGRWSEGSISFAPDTWLVNFCLDFGACDGAIDFERIRLFRREGRRQQIIKDWRFS